MINMTLLSAGAAESLVRNLGERLRNELDIEVSGTFGAVGAMRQRFLAGDACDILVTSAKVMAELAQAGHLQGEVSDLGWVDTGVAVLERTHVPDVSTAASAEAVFRRASSLYFPDPDHATAGIHFASVLGKIGLDSRHGDAMKAFPNGRTAMRALAASQDPEAVGCTQKTEILQTDGVEYAGSLPEPYALATLYQCAVVARATNSSEAREVTELLTGAETASDRDNAGFRA